MLVMRSFTEGIRSVAPEDVDIEEISVEGRVFVLVGEDHYSSGTKESLAMTISKAYETGTIGLFVESDDIAARSEADTRLATASGVLAGGRVPDGASNSLLRRLTALGSPHTFFSRPELVNGGLLVGPESLAQVLFVSGQCLDLRRGRALSSFQTATDVAMDVAGSALYVAERMVESGAIEEALEPTVFDQLLRNTKPLVELARERLGAPVRGQLAEAMTTGGASFLDALNRVIFSPHVVSDAAFATQLVRLTDPGVYGKPVVVVCGKAHMEAIGEDLRVLLTRPR